MSLSKATPASPVEAVYFGVVDCVFKELQAGGFSIIDKNTAEAFVVAWKEGIKLRLENPSPFSARGETRKQRRLTSSARRSDQSCRREVLPDQHDDDDFEDANVDQPSEPHLQDSLGINLAEEEIRFLSSAGGRAAPSLEDLTDVDSREIVQGHILGTFEKVTRPAETGKRLSDTRPACWTLTVKNGVMKVSGREFAFDRLEAEVKES
ncbi:hypothetical protein BESB_002950 [Besnoitia besnoiti]|uniref:Uncharacterized protein n=1 Tax=Besnoitia besnoiti TaxID=94643 RepID=A0A2A9ML38_BESBE|nr:hypothetical protein BESB_002950 [Besnoitia besnoiti]PFH37954.1 hypothetical protein BESB_002950 [Besnoitia besnoiti]